MEFRGKNRHFGISNTMKPYRYGKKLVVHVFYYTYIYTHIDANKSIKLVHILHITACMELKLELLD